MNIEDTFALIAERSKLAEEYIQGKISKELYYAEMERIDQLLSAK